MKQVKTIYFFPLLSWNSELLHREQMLAIELAKIGKEVIFINRITRSPWKLLSENHKCIDSGVTIRNVYCFPYLKGVFGFVYKLNNWLLGRQVGLKENSIVYLTNPDWSEILGKKCDNIEIVYDISDDFVLLAKNKFWRRRVKKFEELAVSISSKFIITSENLRNKLPKNSVYKVVTNGVDFAGFKKSQPVLDKGEYKKIAGFIGGIYEWVNLELIKKSALAFPEILFVLIGPTNRKAEIKNLESITNIKYLGAANKTEIANYFASLNIGLVPFLSEDDCPRLATVDSNKIYQYLYFGYPVVSSDFSQVRNLSDYILISKNSDEFIKNLSKAIEMKTSDLAKKFAMANTWDKKAKEIIDFLTL